MLLETLFSIASSLALAGWLVLLPAPLIPRWSERVAGLAIPLLLAIGYTGLILAFWSRAEGGFDSLASVTKLFGTPELVLAGWVHYLAFDLLIGAWEVRTARAERIPHLAVIPCLGLTFIFGPVGFLAFSALRGARAMTATQATTEANRG